MYQRIRDLREDKDLNQTAMGKLLAVSQTTYSDYELGKLNIPIPVLVRLAEIHETSIDYLLGITDEPKPYPRKKER